MVKKKTSFTDKVNNKLEDAQTDPIIFALIRASAGWIYVLLRIILWPLSLIFGNQAVVLALAKTYDKLNQ